ncbi:MAG TPA: rhomboid family intramembrane serine protease, partial [Gemmataceae bacterium]|nr:rhomboid family intramembrane serine protease [Gemmataceae bacterium]
MGIYDREYYRRDKTSFLGSIADRGNVCKWLILINGICFVIQLVTIPPRHQGYGPFTEALWLVPQKVLDGEIWRLLTHAFLHAPDSWTHIIFNMLFLWWLGRDVEDIYGSREFLAFYLVAAVLAGLAFLGWGLAQRSNAPALGASGAVTAVMVVCACHYPNRQFLFSFFIPIPLWLLVIINVLQDTFVFVSQTKTTVAVAAHLDGAAFG